MNLGSGTICQNGCAVRPKGNIWNKQANKRKANTNEQVDEDVCSGSDGRDDRREFLQHPERE